MENNSRNVTENQRSVTYLLIPLRFHVSGAGNPKHQNWLQFMMRIGQENYVTDAMAIYSQKRIRNVL